MRGWEKAQDRFGVLPEEFDPTDWSITSKGNALRPNWPIQPSPCGCTTATNIGGMSYARISSTMKRTSKVAHGYSGLKDVTVARRLERCLPGLLVVRADEILLADLQRLPALRLSRQLFVDRRQCVEGIEAMKPAISGTGLLLLSVQSPLDSVRPADQEFALAGPPGRRDGDLFADRRAAHRI